MSRAPRSAKLLLAGIPAAGKSTYGDWLKEHHDFVHIDVDKIGSVNLLEAVRTGHRVALDWGFPPSSLGAVVQLRNTGVLIWWFDGDHAAAEKSYFARPSSPARHYFERQMAGIKAHWKAIESVFAGRIIQTVDKHGHYLSCEQIFEIMFPTTP